jgi:hypothetical protein
MRLLGLDGEGWRLFGDVINGEVGYQSRILLARIRHPLMTFLQNFFPMSKNLAPSAPAISVGAG